MSPFEDGSLTGLELELLAPEGRSRGDLAWRVADELGGRVRCGLKYSSEGLIEDGRPICTLTPAFAVLDAEDRVAATVVDDTTIRQQTRPDAPTLEGWYRVVTDDVRLALLVERLAWSDAGLGVADVLEPVRALFEGVLKDPGEGTDDPEHRVLADRYGHPVGVVASLPGQRERVAEVVTRPLDRTERGPLVQAILRAASALGFEVPVEAALHVHVDAPPWRSTRKLKGLITHLSDQRSAFRSRFPPNPRCRGLGPYPDAVIRVAQEADDALPFTTFATALEMAGASKRCDVNLLGVIRRYPLHPTLEVRSLAMTTDPAPLLRTVEDLEAYLAEIWAAR